MIRATTLRRRVALALLLVSALLVALAANVAEDAWEESQSICRDRVLNETAKRINTLCALIARERGIGNTLLGGDTSMRDSLLASIREVDFAVDRLETQLEQHRSTQLEDLDPDALRSWRTARSLHVSARARLHQGRLSSEEWLGATTEAVLQAFALRDQIYAPTGDSDAYVHFNTVVRPQLGFLAEFAGRERALIGKTLAEGGPIPVEQRKALEGLRSRVDHATRLVLKLGNLKKKPERLSTALERFKQVFLGSYEALRRDIYRTGESSAASIEAARVSMGKASESLLASQRGFKRTTRALANNPSLVSAAQTLEAGEALPADGQLEAMLASVIDVHDHVLKARYLDSTGRERYRVDRTDGRPRVVPARELQDKRERPYFRQARHLPRGSVYVSPLDLNQEYGRVERPFRPVIRYATPVFAGSRSLGVLVFSVAGTPLLHGAARASGCLLVDAEGYYMHHPDPSKEWGMMTELGRSQHRLQVDRPEFAEVLLQNQAGAQTVGRVTLVYQPVDPDGGDPNRRWTLVRELQAEGHPLSSHEWIQESTLAIDSVLALSEAIGAEADASLAQATLANRKNSVLAWGAVFLVIVVLLGFARQASEANRKLKAISEGLRKLAAGELSHRLPTSENPDELDAIGAWIKESTAQTERLVEQAQAASDSKSSFLATMSHEIRTPLNGILGMTELLRGSPLSDDQREQFEVITSSGDTLLAVISDVLDFSKIEADRLEIEAVDFDLHEVIRSSAALFKELAHKKGVSLQVSSVAGLPRSVRGDPLRLRQVLNNLLSNAVKFTSSGRIRLRAESLAESPGHIGISVEDTGIGITDEALSSLFDPFSQAESSTTRRFGGTGLGLSICRRLVELMGGEITATSTPGVGSRFSLRLPLESVSPPPVEVPEQDSLDLVLPAKARVLIVDDNLVNRKIFQALVAKLGLTSQVAENGASALAALEQASFDLVLLDCHMPVMDGYEACRTLRERERDDPSLGHTIVIAITASATDGDRERCLAAGMDDYLTKPVRVSILKATLHRWLAGQVQVQVQGAGKAVSG